MRPDTGVYQCESMCVKLCISSKDSSLRHHYSQIPNMLHLITGK